MILTSTTLLPPPTNPLFDAASSVQLAVVVVSFGALYALQLALRFNPGGALSWKLYPAAFGGFYLDEAFTRMTFKLWPPKDLPPRERKAVSVHDTHTVGSAA